MALGISSQSMPLDDLYREIILDHYRNPRHRGNVDGATGRVEASNPLCGDQVCLSWRQDGDRISDIAFEGQGCSICMAATSMLCDTVTGQTTERARAIVDGFRGMLLEGRDGEDLGDVEALKGVAAFPVRIKCAILSWNALQQGLGSDV
jgi:nitrogen fixation NifU-like protein